MKLLAVSLWLLAFGCWPLAVRRVALLVDCSVPLLACKQCWVGKEYSIASSVTIAGISDRFLARTFFPVAHCLLASSGTRIIADRRFHRADNG